MCISNAAFYPLSFDGVSPTAGASEYLQDPAIQLLVDFFGNLGLEALKQQDGQEDWYQDWIAWQAQHGLYASLLSPKCYSTRGHQFDLRRFTRFLEVFAYFSPAHAYSLHVSFLGLAVVLMSDNEPLKREAIARVEAGELFALAVSEKAHGADLMANEFSVRTAGSDGMLADGEKYYIGNSNAAGLISVLARMVDGSETGPTRRSAFVFFALRPDQAPGFQNIQKIRTLGIRAAFVGEFEVRDHPVAEADVISRGRSAWDAVFATVNLGKFFLGFGAIGSCSHAFAEAHAHMHGRVLYGKRVTEIPHLRMATASAFARLTAMKMYACRALDYLQASCAGDRRYLLFNAVQKARVSTEGVKVMALLSECVGAWGFQAENFFESALRDTQLIPALESSTHINFELTARFVEPYFHAADTDTPPVPPIAADAGENLYWMEARYRNFGTVRFVDCLKSYDAFSELKNVSLFVQQVSVFRRFARVTTAALNPVVDAGQRVTLGRCFSIIAYAQLIAENCHAIQMPRPLVSVIFHGLIQDLTQEALQLAAMFPDDGSQRAELQRMVRVPETNAAEFEHVSELIEKRYTKQQSPLK
ncbi:MAG: acyl-CoA dehydrogenase family protein [Fuerstiella sp.]